MFVLVLASLARWRPLCVGVNGGVVVGSDGLVMSLLCVLASHGDGGERH